MNTILGLAEDLVSLYVAAVRNDILGQGDPRAA